MTSTGGSGNYYSLVKVDQGAFAGELVTRSEKTVYDLIPELEATNGWISDKPDGVAITEKGQVFVITDNDGVDGWSGETWFLHLGKIAELFEDRNDHRDEYKDND